MSASYAIGPSVGVARLGNSPDEFYLEPETIGGRPLECDAQGNAATEAGGPAFVTFFKDVAGRVKRQGARFRIYRTDTDSDTEVTLETPDVASITWTVHLANKKSCWFTFSELEGNLLLGPKNSYAAREVERRNQVDAEGNPVRDRRKLIIDPGPRSVTGAGQKAHFTADTAPPRYKHCTFPPKPDLGATISTLGELRTDSAGRLIVLGGHGDCGGIEPIASFGGADTWYDDVSDGPVSCRLVLKSGETIMLRAWCIVGSPKFAPELVNITTLDDTMYDVAVRHLNAAPELFADDKYNAAYVANFDRDISPILERPAGYRWVANVPSMSALASARFNPRDVGAGAAAMRQACFALFRAPGPENTIDPSHNALFSTTGVPLMPVNSGSNSVSDKPPENIDNFMALTETQYFLLSQWAKGTFTSTPAQDEPAHVRLSRASTGNCVGAPFCPGIEVTWTTRNRNIYDAAWSIRHRKPSEWYFKHGLDPDRDETADAGGCEPGDLTKRMAVPWQADFFQCSIQYIDFRNPDAGNAGIPDPPTYYAYWWPPQSPWHVVTGDLTTAGQFAAGTPAGYQVLYARGINSFQQMIESWSYMGFVANQATGPHRDIFAYFTEQERAHDKFTTASYALGEASNVENATDVNFANAWFLTPPRPSTPVRSAPAFAGMFAARAAAPAQPAAPAPSASKPLVTFATSRRRGRVPGRG
jgi:L-lysine 6-oxidase